MRTKDSFGRKVFVSINYFLLGSVSLLCLFPIIHILAVSFSSKWACISRGRNALAG